MNIKIMEQIKGKSVKYGAPGAERYEIVQELIYCEEHDCIQVIFQDGGFTCLMNQDFNYFLQEGVARYKWGGEAILESCEDIE